ncbi:hypothetical protein MRX96_006408 [Rhipicephalus microplus]
MRREKLRIRWRVFFLKGDDSPAAQGRIGDVYATVRLNRGACAAARYLVVSLRAEASAPSVYGAVVYTQTHTYTHRRDFSAAARAVESSSTRTPVTQGRPKRKRSATAFGVCANAVQVSSPSIPGKRVLKRRFPQGCSDPGCVRPETRLHRSLLQLAQRSDTLPARVAGTFERAALGQARDRSSGPRTNQPPLRRTAWALTPTPSAVGHDRSTARRNRSKFEPTTPPILSNECIASSLVWW